MKGQVITQGNTSTVCLFSNHLGSKLNNKVQDNNDYFNSFHETRLFNFSILKEKKRDHNHSSNWGKKSYFKSKSDFNGHVQRQTKQKDYYSLDHPHSSLIQDNTVPLISPLIKKLEKKMSKLKVKHKIKVK